MAKSKTTTLARLEAEIERRVRRNLQIPKEYSVEVRAVPHECSDLNLLGFIMVHITECNRFTYLAFNAWDLVGLQNTFGAKRVSIGTALPVDNESLSQGLCFHDIDFDSLHQAMGTIPKKTRSSVNAKRMAGNIKKRR